MKSIGPYVVLREANAGQSVPGEAGPGDWAAPRRRAPRTLRAADRLTGLPVLLHPLDAIAPVPSLPQHPRLLPFTDMVVEMARAYLVTELPPQTGAARDPLPAARAALEVLNFLHGQGLTHGSLDAAQFWEVDGQVRVSGAGLPRPGLRPTPADDLRDLANALEDLGGLPSILAVLRTAGDSLSAGEILDLLNVGLTQEQLAEALEHMPMLSAAGTPALDDDMVLPVPFDDHEEIVLGGALADEILGLGPVEEAAPPTPTPAETAPVDGATPEPAPETAPAEAPAPTPVNQVTPVTPVTFPLPSVSPEPVALGPVPATDSEPLPNEAAPPELGEFRRIGPADSPGTADSPAEVLPAVSVPVPPAERPRMIRRAARQASDRLKADNRRRLDISALRRQRTAATIEQLQGEGGTDDTASLDSLAPSAAATAGNESDQSAGMPTPQERRRLEQQAWEEQVALDAQLAAARRAREEQDRTESIFPAGSGLNVAPSEIAEMERLPRHRAASASGGPQRAQKRRLAPIRMSWGRDGERRVLRRLGPREELLRWLLPALGLLVVAFAAAALPRALRPAPAPCCDVQFRLSGAADQRARLTLLQAPEATGWKLGMKLGEVPGTVRLPAPGTYRIKVNADGYAPARVNVTVPTRDPVTVNLSE